MLTGTTWLIVLIHLRILNSVVVPQPSQIKMPPCLNPDIFKVAGVLTILLVFVSLGDVGGQDEYVLSYEAVVQQEGEFKICLFK